MLFHVSWEFIDTTEEGQKRSLSVFSQWQPPEGADFRPRPTEPKRIATRVL